MDMAVTETTQSGNVKRYGEVLRSILERASDMEFVDEAGARRLDNEFRAVLAKASKGMSPVELASAYFDWIAHLTLSPGKQLQLAQSFVRKMVKLGIFSVESLFNSDAKGPASRLERRVSGEVWQKWPFKVFAQSHQISRDWWHEATHNVEGATKENQILVGFMADQILEAISPGNFPLTNPDILNAKRKERGAKLLRGFKNLLTDQINTALSNTTALQSDFKVGENIAITPSRLNSSARLPPWWPWTAKMARSATPVGRIPHLAHISTIASERTGTVQRSPSV